MGNPPVPSRLLPIVVVLLLGAGAFLMHARMRQQRFIEGESTPLTETVRSWTPPAAIAPTTVEFRWVWYEDDRSPHEVTSLDAVPFDRRDFVHALPMDPSRVRDREVFMVDLTQPRPDGSLPFRVVARERFEADLLALASRRARTRRR
jgi:hypothetical protein